MANSEFIHQFINGLTVDTDTAEVSPVYGSAANTIVQGNDLRLSTAQKRTVKLNPGAGQYSDIQAAIDSITDASATKPYQINVGPGQYDITNSIVLKPYVHLRGERTSTIINITDETKPVLIGAPGSSVAQFSMGGSGVSGTDVGVIEYVGDTLPIPFRIDIIDFKNCHTAVKLNGASPNFAVASINNCTFTSSQLTFGFTVTGTATQTLLLSNTVGQFTQAGHDIQAFVYVAGASNRLIINNSLSVVEGAATADDFIRVESGATCNIQSVGIEGYDQGLHVPNVGAGPNINISNLSVVNSGIWDVLIENPNTTGFVSGAFETDKTNVNVNATVAISHSDPANNNIGFAVIGDILQGTDESQLVNLTKLLRGSATIGLVSGGEISRGTLALEIDVAEGTGFARDGSGVIQEVSFNAVTLTIGTDQTRFVTVNTAGTVQLEATLPANFADRIILGRVSSGDLGIIALETSALSSNDYGNQVEKYLRSGLGVLFTSGALISENGVTARALDITSGEFFFGTNLFSVSSQTGLTFNRVFQDGVGGFTLNPAQTVVPNNLYDDGSGTLAAVPAGRFVKHTVVQNPDEAGGHRYAVFIGQATYATLGEAQDGPANNLAPQINSASTAIAEVITQEGQANFAAINDIRPRLGFAQSAASAVSDHGSLSGLEDNDHDQYLLRGGGNTMTANLDLGGNDIVNAGIIPGTSTAAPVTLTPDQANTEGVSADKARADHVHNVPAESAVTISAATPNAEGTNASFARSDHTHDISTGAPITQVPDQLNAEGTSANLARADHVHAIATDVPVTLNPDVANAEGVSTSFSRADHVHNVPADVAVGLNANSTNTEGNSTSFARANHTHDLDTGVPVTQTPDQLNAEGTSTSLARADHVHEIATATAVEITPEAGNSEGVSTSFARADHVHNIPSGAAVTIGANSTNTEGVAAAFARTDHTHDMNTGVVSTQTPDQTNAEGTSDNLARADHVHNIPTVAPITNLTGDTTNQEGIAATFSRSDHVHAIDTGNVVSQTPDQVNSEGVSPNLARADHVHNIPAATAVGLDGDTVSAEGVAASFARSDHTHAIATGNVSTLNPDQVNSEGVSPNLARADHIHNVPADIAVTLGANSTNQEGVSTSFSRADHTHDLNTGVVSTLNPDQANAEGVSDNLARADHIHNVPTDVPVDVGAGNSEGVSTSFARADHVHNIFPVFNFLFAQNPTPQTTNSGTPVLALNLTTGALPLGTYKIEWVAELNVDSTSRNAEYQFQLNDVETLGSAQFSPPTVTNYFPIAGMAIRTFSGIQSLDLDYFRSGGGGANVTIRNVRITITRVG